MQERVTRILEISRRKRELRERASAEIEVDEDADGAVLHVKTPVVALGDNDALIARLAALQAKNEVLTMKLEASERARRELCERLERVTFRVKQEEIKFQTNPSTSYERSTLASEFARSTQAISFMDSPFIMSSSAERMVSSYLSSEEPFQAPVSPIAVASTGMLRAVAHAVTPVQREQDLVSLFEKAEISPTGPLDFESSPGANDSSVLSTPPASVTKSRDEYIDDLLRRARKPRTAKAKTDEVSATYDDENDPPSPQAQDVLVFEHDLTTPPTVSRRPPTPMAPLRHQNHRHADDVQDEIADGRRSRPDCRERWNVRPRALF
jgi:hypothetical protein